MVFSLNIRAFSICAIILFIGITSVQASNINLNGQLDYIQLDKGGGIYSGVAIGTEFTGSIDDANANGFISDGSTNTSFGCCIAAGGLSVTNDMVLTEEDVAFLNEVLGSSNYSTGDQIDIVDIEGDKTTSSGGRIEIGLSYIFDSSTFSNDDLSNYPFNSDDVELALFFIYEENALGQDIYSAGGKIQVPFSSAEFDSTSGNITNQLLPIKNGDWFKYIGYGDMAGETETWEVVGTEVVDSVNCLKLKVGDATVWLAQDTDGNVWFLKIITEDGVFTLGSGISNPFIYAEPKVGDRLSNIFPESAGTYGKVTEIGVDVNLSTGLGPYENCIGITDYFDYEVEDLEYYCPGIGLVKSIYPQERPPETGEELSEFGNDGPEDDVEGFVIRFYQLCLDREPDSAGLNGWVSALLDGSQTGSDVGYGFVFSNEFINKPTTNEEYLQVLYEAFFNRQPDPGGWQGWIDAIKNGASREDVLKGFIFAQEFAELCDKYGIIPFRDETPKPPIEKIKDFVTRFYQLCLDRDPDSAGLEGWSNDLLNRIKTGADVANGFIYSQEFINKNTTNDEYLTILYKAFFDRPPDQAGWDVWIAELIAGNDRGYVLNGFLGSQEFINLCEDYGIIPY